MRLCLECSARKHPTDIDTPGVPRWATLRQMEMADLSYRVAGWRCRVLFGSWSLVKDLGGRFVLDNISKVLIQAGVQF